MSDLGPDFITKKHNNLMKRMKTPTLLMTALLSMSAVHHINASVSVGNLSVDGRTTPLNVESSAPRLSWVIDSDERDVMQKAYHIMVASSPEKLDAGAPDLWDSGKVNSGQSLRVDMEGRNCPTMPDAFGR